MFDGLFKPKFYNKCKQHIKTTKKRLDAIKKKRNAVEKILKNHIAHLLRNGFDIVAYGKAEGLLVEKIRSSCYELIENFCGTISNNLYSMLKQRECPKECREAVPSLIYAAARFADLPELRNLRNLFTEKYGNSLECWTNKEFMEILRPKQPTKEIKLQLMQEIANEFSIEWSIIRDIDNDLEIAYISNEDVFPRRKTQNDHGNRNSNIEEYYIASKESESNLKSQETRRGLSSSRDANDSDEEEEEERILDWIVMNSSEKRPPYDNGKPKANPKSCIQLKDDDGFNQGSTTTRQRSRKAELVIPPPVRASSMPPEPTAPYKAKHGYARGSSLLPEMLSMAGHVHPKLPEYDDLAARIAALRGT